jgi:hypothetical protein
MPCRTLSTEPWPCAMDASKNRFFRLPGSANPDRSQGALETASGKILSDRERSGAPHKPSRGCAEPSSGPPQGSDGPPQRSGGAPEPSHGSSRPSGGASERAHAGRERWEGCPQRSYAPWDPSELPPQRAEEPWSPSREPPEPSGAPSDGWGAPSSGTGRPRYLYIEAPKGRRGGSGSSVGALRSSSCLPRPPLAGLRPRRSGCS